MEMTEGSSEPAAGKRLKCPGCAYTTVVWEDDGHIAVCPKCDVDGLMPEETAATVRANRMREAGTFEEMATVDLDELIETHVDDDEPVRLMDEVRTVNMSVKADTVTVDREAMKQAIEDQIEEVERHRANSYRGGRR